MKKASAVLFLLSFMVCGCGMVEKAASNQPPSVESAGELIEALEESMESGKESYTFISDSLDESSLTNVNEDLDSFYGFVNSCETKTGTFTGKEITCFFTITDNTYVERAVLYDEGIPEDRTKAKALFKKCKDIIESELEDRETAYQKERAIHDYLVKNVAYGYPDQDKSNDSDAYSSYGALVKNMAVCNGYAQAMKLLCDLSEIPCDIMTGVSQGSNHAWNIVKLEDGEWYQVDATWDDPKPDVAGRILYNYFNITDEQIRLDHSWEDEGYPSAEGTKYNYFIMNDLDCGNYEEFRSKCREILNEDSPKTIQLLVRDYDESVYNNESLQFIFEIDKVKSLSYQVMGEKPYNTLYLALSYQ